MRLAAKLAWRDLRGGFRGLRIFLACLILGVTIIAAIGSLSASLVAGLNAQGKNILGGDIDFRLVHRKATAEEYAFLRAQGTVSHSATMRAMARFAEDTSLVELKIIDAAYPLYGTLRTTPNTALADGQGWVEPILLEQLNVKIGDIIDVGNAAIQLVGLIEEEPDRLAGGFAVGPRLMINQTTLVATKLDLPGSLINHHYRIKLSEGNSIAYVMTQAKARFPLAGWRIRSFEDASPSLRRSIERIGLFLTMVGLSVLIIGGVGVGNAIHAYLATRRTVIAIFKSLGMSERLVFFTYALQILWLSGIGILCGLALGAGVLWPLDWFFGALLPVGMVKTIFPMPLITAAGFGFFTACIFSLWPLGKLYRLSAADLFRERIGEVKTSPPFIYMIAILFSIVGLIAIAVMISETMEIILWFSLGLGAIYMGLRGAAFGVKMLARRVKNAPPFFIGAPLWRLALSNFYRPGNATNALILSMGLAVSLLTAIALINGNFTKAMQNEFPDQAPSFFFLDIQPDQIEQFEALARAQSGFIGLQKSPLLRGAILAVNDISAENVKAAPEAQWVLRGDRGLTYSAQPPEGTKFVAGTWWPADYEGPPLISLDIDIARGLNIGIGDKISVNILGRPLTGEVYNLRKVNWAEGGINFAMIFSPQPLQYAPHTFMATLSLDTAQENAFRRDITAAFPNITTIRVKEAITDFAALLENFTLAVQIISLFTILAGIFVLAGAFASGRHARAYDAVMMKILGAQSGQILRGAILEYALMGCAVALIAGVAAFGLAWVLVTQLMELAWSLSFIDSLVISVTTLTITISGAIICGLAFTLGILYMPAAPVLRRN